MPMCRRKLWLSGLERWWVKDHSWNLHLGGHPILLGVRLRALQTATLSRCVGISLIVTRSYRGLGSPDTNFHGHPRQRDDDRSSIRCSLYGVLARRGRLVSNCQTELAHAMGCFAVGVFGVRDCTNRWRILPRSHKSQATDCRGCPERDQLDTAAAISVVR